MRRKHFIQTKTRKVPLQSFRNMSNDVWNQSLGCSKHKTSIMFQPENSFVFRKSTGMRGNSVGSAHHETEALCQTTDSNRSHEPLLYSRILIQVSKDGWHLVEAVESATLSISQCVFGRPCFEKLQTSDVTLPGWIFLRFSPAIWVLLYSQTSFKQF